MKLSRNCIRGVVFGILGTFVNPSPIAAPTNKIFAPNPAMDRFVADLLSRMTLEEKIGQLSLLTADMAVTGPKVRDNYRDAIKQGKVGSIFNAFTPEFTRQLQELAAESRLKIPLLFGHDVIHGHRTIFPMPLAEASSWNLDLIKKTARISALEAAADGIHWVYAPMVDLARDPRWGRVAEGAGEDAWLGSKIATARVEGTQGSSEVVANDSVLACVKHFAAYGAPEAGRDYNIVNMDQRSLMEYLQPYKAAIDAGVASVMTSFNEINGVPATSNSWLLDTLLRRQWKFQGFVVTDYTSINELVPHGVAENEKIAGAMAIKAGVDMDMQGEIFEKYLGELVKENAVGLTQIDRAVTRVLEAKYRLGLFADAPVARRQMPGPENLMSAAHLEHARDIARRSIVLLKNDKVGSSGKAALPLSSKTTVALIGPLAKNVRDQVGSWRSAGDWSKVVSLWDAMKEKHDAPKSKIEVKYAKGANLLEPGKLLTFLNNDGGNIEIDKKSADQLLREALQVARKSDVVVLALGESQGMTGEAASRTRIRLPENQLRLLREVKKIGKPVVLVLFNGRPLVLEEEFDLADSIVEAWLLGHQAGRAIADVLFGDYNPSGKLTMTFPRSEGQIPIYYSAKSTGRPHDPNQKYRSNYIDSPNDPLFPFGWGLSYSHFEYSDITLSSNVMSMNAREPITASVKVKNVGAVDGEETVQLYVQDLFASVTRPGKELRGFQKVFLKAGETRTVSLPISLEDLKFYDIDLKFTAEPGDFKVYIGGNSKELIETRFRLE